MHFETILRNVTAVFILFFSRDHVSCHIVSLDREYLFHVH